MWEANELQLIRIAYVTEQSRATPDNSKTIVVQPQYWDSNTRNDLNRSSSEGRSSRRALTWASRATRQLGAGCCLLLPAVA